MAVVALILYVAFLALVFGARAVLLRRQTGTSGFHGISGRPGSLQWIGGVTFVVAVGLGVIAPALALAEVVTPVPALDTTAVHVAGLVLFAAGTAGALAAQGAMGRSWRVGVDDDERTELVAGGLFAQVRNPFFAAMVPSAIGLALLVPSVVALVAVVALLIAVELQVRWVEEPYLRQAHGRDYQSYAGRTGRFVPGIGRLTR